MPPRPLGLRLRAWRDSADAREGNDAHDPDPQEFLRRLEDRLSGLERWLAARRHAGERHIDRLREHLEMLRRDAASARQGTATAAHDGMARARATVADMERDYEAQLPGFALRREELHALNRHLQLTATLLPHVSNLDDPAWGRAHEEYEQSWDEVRRAFDEGRAAVP